MGNISKHFNREEISCNCGCGQDTIDYKLIMVLEDVREHFGKPIIVTSGNRCIPYNKTVGGVKTSQHTLGRACDIKVSGVAPCDVYDYINGRYPTELGLGNYPTFTHVDSRNLLSRWGSK